MKFGKDYQNELIPEWRVKYLDYRTGKKKLKAVSRAYRNTNGSSRNTGGFSPAPEAASRRSGGYTFLSRDEQVTSDEEEVESSGPVAIPPRAANERSSLAQHADNQGRNYGGMTRYGSIIGTPPDADEVSHQPRDERASSLHLPAPAMDNEAASQANEDGPQKPAQAGRSVSTQSVNVSPAGSLQNSKQQPGPKFQRLANKFQPKRVNSLPGPPHDTSKRPFASRVLSFNFRRSSQHPTPDSVPLEAYKELEARQNDFFGFLDAELKKIDGFYREKEDEATNRLKTLREQLHVMRDRRMEEVTAAQRLRKQDDRHEDSNGKAKGSKSSDSNGSNAAWLKPFDKAFDKAVDRAKVGHVGQTFRAMQDLGTPSGPSAVDLYRDYTTKPVQSDVSYRTAKHKLKIALAEYYRGLELLKSYALLNRTAFRKINKKYDKTVNAQPTGRYMSEKVSKAYFVNSEVVEGHMHAVEDLYSRYFERGNRKVAVSKLRAKLAKAGEYSASAFRTGVLLALGTAFGVEGLVYAVNSLEDPNEMFAVHTQLLLQVYGGYFLAVLLALFFCLACRIWHQNKVNYTFVFEFDTRRQVLDWRQLTQIPSVFYFLLGLVSWLDFRQFGGSSMYLLWPIVLASVTALLLFNPLPVFYPKSRGWFINTNWRLIFSGIYPVEFRDFFMGDLFCSQTYALGNMVIFFCLYSERPIWGHPAVCSSSSSRLLGFFTCLPGIWRALQCIRRYKDTQNFFPHLVNCGKYFCTIAYYLTLSLYRMNHSTTMKALFITFATINAIYVSIWDLGMDFSLMDPYAKYRFLRQNLAFKSVYPYYIAIVIDPIIRFNWILYAIYTEDPKHAAMVSFFVGFTEVCRRGMWMVFRVENEHCANVGRFRAYRDAPLPYEQAEASETGSITAASRSPDESGDERNQRRAEQITGEQAVAMEEGLPMPEHLHGQAPQAPTTGADYRAAANKAASDNNELRRRKGQPVNESPIAQALIRAGTMMHLAHTQDFERRRRPGLRDMNREEEDDDADDSDNSDTELEEAAIERARANSGNADASAGK